MTSGVSVPVYSAAYSAYDGTGCASNGSGGINWCGQSSGDALMGVGMYGLGGAVPRPEGRVPPSGDGMVGFATPSLAAAAAESDAVVHTLQVSSALAALGKGAGGRLSGLGENSRFRMSRLRRRVGALVGVAGEECLRAVFRNHRALEVPGGVRTAASAPAWSLLPSAKPVPPLPSGSGCSNALETGEKPGNASVGVAKSLKVSGASDAPLALAPGDGDAANVVSLPATRAGGDTADT